MSWFRNEKSVANRAQKVVSDMLVQLEKKNSRINKLEGVVLGLQEACVAPIEAEILRLEKRREVLQQEITDTDDMLSKQRTILKETRHTIKQQLTSSEAENKPQVWSEDSVVMSHSGDKKLQDTLLGGESDGVEVGASSSTNDDLYDEECEMVDIIRELEPQLLFVLHRGNTDDIILYVPPHHRMNPSFHNGQSSSSSDSGTDKQLPENRLIFLYRLQVYNDMDSAELVSSFEIQMGFGPKIVSNNKRHDPSVTELPHRFFNSTHIHDNTALNSSSIDRSGQEVIGEFIYAMELPVMPNVVIDIWRVPVDKQPHTNDKSNAVTKRRQDIYFATTTIQGVPFVNLQRIFLMVETKWGMPTIVGIELSGRVSPDGGLLVEVIANES